MNEIIKIINEEISAITRDKKKEIFDYNSAQEEVWFDLKHEAQKFQRISFDFENDDSVGKKTFFVKKNLRKDQPIKYEIQADMHIAGGDWETGAIYFRIEFTHDYGVFRAEHENKPEFVFDTKDFSGRKFCIIPPVEAGNKLIKREKENEKYDWGAYQNNELTKEEEKEAYITDTDKKDCWKWLQELIEKLVDDRHEMLDK